MFAARHRFLVSLLAVGALVVALPASVAMAGGDPPGNNGTVKADSDLLNTTPSNEPHVGCTFQLAAYGFDNGEDLFADVTMEVIAPTGSGILVANSFFIGQDDASGAGTDTGLDAVHSYDLNDSFGDLTPSDQGYHIRVTVHADGSQGADKKHKTFWVSGCVPTPPDEEDDEDDEGEYQPEF